MERLSWETVSAAIPARSRDAQKGDFGRLLCITGSGNMPGACFLSTEGALRSGAGLVTVATVPENVMRLASAIPEAMWLPLKADRDGFFLDSENHTLLASPLQRADAVLLGCGMGVTAETRKLTQWMLESAECPVILDADGLNCVASCIDSIRREKSDWIFTPHPGEMARLTGCSIREIQADRAKTAQGFSRQYPVTLVLKGAGTLVAQQGRIVQNCTGNPGMSRGGSGDVLAGMIAAFAAQGLSSWDAACAGVFLHGTAGDVAAEALSEQGMLPRDMLRYLPAVFGQLERCRPENCS